MEGEKDLRASEPGVPEARALTGDRFKRPCGPCAELRSSTICCLTDVLSATSSTCFWFHGPTVGMSPALNLVLQPDTWQLPLFHWERTEEWSEKDARSMELETSGCVQGKERQEVMRSCFMITNDT